MRARIRRALPVVTLGGILRVRICSACHAVVLGLAEDAHAEWHRAERERLDVAQRAAVREALAHLDRGPQLPTPRSADTAPMEAVR